MSKGRSAPRNAPRNRGWHSATAFAPRRLNAEGRSCSCLRRTPQLRSHTRCCRGLGAVAAQRMRLRPHTGAPSCRSRAATRHGPGLRGPSCRACGLRRREPRGLGSRAARPAQRSGDRGRQPANPLRSGCGSDSVAKLPPERAAAEIEQAVARAEGARARVTGHPHPDSVAAASAHYRVSSSLAASRARVALLGVGLLVLLHLTEPRHHSRQRRARIAARRVRARVAACLTRSSGAASNACVSARVL